MEISLTIKKILPRAILLIKYNLVLVLPFLAFLLIIGFVLFPLGAVGGPLAGLLLIALVAVFLSGWLNMFKKCLDTTENEKETNEERTMNSLQLFKEFFPGVGNYFIKILFGMLIYFFLFNLLILLLEILIIPLFGQFESFSARELPAALKDLNTASAFFNNISDSDKTRIFQIAGIEFIFTVLYFYLGMFWAQIVVIKNLSPIKALIKSFKTVIKEPLDTFVIFFLSIVVFVAVYFFGVILLVIIPAFLSPILGLLTISLFILTIILFLMMTFLYLEKNILQEKINSNSRSNSIEQN